MRTHHSRLESRRGRDRRRRLGRRHVAVTAGMLAAPTAAFVAGGPARDGRSRSPTPMPGRPATAPPGSLAPSGSAGRRPDRRRLDDRFEQRVYDEVTSSTSSRARGRDRAVRDRRSRA